MSTTLASLAKIRSRVQRHSKTLLYLGTAEVANKRIRDIANKEDIVEKADAGTPLIREGVWKFFHFSDSRQQQ